MTDEHPVLSRRRAIAGMAAIAVPLMLALPRGKAAVASPAKAKPFTDLFGTPVRGRIQLDRSVYDIGDAMLAWTLSNTWVKGAPGGSRIRGTARTLMNLQSSHDCVFEDIVFEVTSRAAEASSYHAAVRAAHVVLRNHRFVRCRFIVRDANQNALKFIAEDGNARIEGLHFEDCTIDGAGRMGIELQNHDKDGVERLIDFRWLGGAVRNTGLLSGSGMGISLSGTGTDHVVDTLFENNRYAALENVGSSNSRFSGRSRLQTRGKTAPISFTNVRVMHNNVISDFVCLDRASGGCRIWNQVDLTMHDNVFMVSDPVQFRGVSGLRSLGDRYDSTGRFVLTVDNYPPFGRGTQNNVWDGVALDARHALGGGMVPIRFSGQGTSNNVLRNVAVLGAPRAARMQAGGLVSNAGGARDNGLTGATTFGSQRR